MITDLVIKYKSKNIDNLSLSKITFRNVGNEILKSTDFAELNKLSLTTNGQFLIDSLNKLEIESSNPYTKTAINLISFNKIEIDFDFLESKNSFSFSIFHTGNVIVCGSIIGEQLISNAANVTTPELEVIKLFKISIFFMIVLSLLICLNYLKMV